VLCEVGGSVKVLEADVTFMPPGSTEYKVIIELIQSRKCS
jgi:hypothetical protein